jgi:O-antigen/teichoic acid export membrane protein
MSTAERAALRAERRAGRLRIATFVVAVLAPWLAVGAGVALLAAHWTAAGFAVVGLVLAACSLLAGVRRLPDLPLPAAPGRPSSVR